MDRIHASKIQCKELKNSISQRKELTIKQLHHLTECEECMLLYTGFVESSSFITAPHYLKDNILKEAGKISEKQERRRRIQYRFQSKQMQLFRYSMKVGLAMCGALFLLFASNIIGGNKGRYYSQNYENSYFYLQKADISGIYSFFDKLDNKWCYFTHRDNQDKYYQNKNQKEELFK